MNKKVSYVILVVAAILSGFLSYSYFSKNTVNTSQYKTPSGEGNNTASIDPGEPRTEECPINGEMLTKTQKDLWVTRRPLGVMIENHPEARPQSGIGDADVVYEAVAEGGITRFLNIFYCKDSTKLIGPVRSARVYFINLVQAYGDHPLYMHVGGANCNKTTNSGCGNGAPADALGTIEDLGWAGYNDLNFPPFPYAYRDYDRLPNVATEHTVYSTTKKLWEYASTKRHLTNVDEDGKAWDSTFSSWKFKEDAPASKPISTISFGFWKNSPDFDVTWKYDTATNSYKRFTAGKPHIDKNTGKQLQFKNVIIAFAKESFADDGYDLGQHMLYKVIGTNDAIVFQDGKAIKGSWKKVDEKSQMRFYDENGTEIKLNRGQDFVEIVPQGNTIDY